jgi:glycosyltransferase involved in cell wall biosynthesis
MLRAGALAVSERGWEPLVLLPERARERDWAAALSEEGVDIAFAPDVGRRQLGRWLSELVAAGEGPTVVHTHFTRFDLPALAAARRNPGVSVLWQVHTVLNEELRIRAANRIKLGLLSRRVSRILCVAPHLVDAVIARGAPRAKVELFPNGVDTAAFAPPSAEARLDARRHLGVAPDAQVLLHFGRDWHGKGGDLFLGAVKRLHEQGRDVVAVTSRGGEAARGLAQELGIEALTLAPEGASEVQTLYAAADLFMSTSRGEGLPFGVLEALASGLPVVATDIRGHELPGGPLANLEIAPIQATELAERAALMLDREPALARSQALTAREGVVARFSLQRLTERLIELYELMDPGEHVRA